jgi:peptidylprolyl isomerase
MHRAKRGDRVRIQYCQVREDAAATNKPPGPKLLEFTVGSSDLIRSISLGVIGMVQGDRKRLTLQPQEAYGKPQARLVREIPRRRFPRHLALRKGQRLTAVDARSGQRRRVKVVAIKPDSVVVDGNHPLAGKVVELEITLISLDSSANANKQKPQFDLGGRG